RNRSRKAVIRVYDDAGNLIETHEHVSEQGVVSVTVECRSDEKGTAFWLSRAAHPNARLNANCSSELPTMNYAKGHSFDRDRVGFSFRALVDRTIREQRREQRRLAEKRSTKHQFHARSSCILDGRNYRIARRLFLF